MPKEVLCDECQNYMGKKNNMFDKYICENCKVFDKYNVMSKTCSKKIYLLKDEDFTGLPSYACRSTYGQATCYTIEDLKNTACAKYGVSKDYLDEYLENARKEKDIKREERSQKIAENKRNKRNKRREEIVKELAKVKLTLRNDSVLCNKYIEGESEYDLEDIVERMCQMKYLFEYCHMDECKQIAYDKYCEEKRAGYYPDYRVFDEAEYIALEKYSGGKYPTVYPWLA